MRPKVIIDADTFLYTSILHNEEVIEVDDGSYMYLWVNPEKVEFDFWDRVSALALKWDADPLIALTDSAHNWRLDVLPTYKGNRKDKRKPIAIKQFREKLAGDESVYFRPRLEADDVVGILATWDAVKGEKLIWSEDKDLMQIPGKHIVGDRVVEVTEEEGHRMHLFQTLAGDVTDGYSGAPGFGEKTAPRWFEQHGWTWEALVEAYESKGLGEGDALIQARVAKIVQASNYDFNSREVILWTP